MKRKNLHKIAVLMLIALLLPGVMLLSPTTAQAQRRTVVIVRPFPRFHRGFGWYPYPYPYYGYYNNYVFGSVESAYDHGYRDGLKTGQKDARRRQSYDPERSHYFRDAGFGNFAVEFRDGFVRGYESGYRS